MNHRKRQQYERSVRELKSIADNNPHLSPLECQCLTDAAAAIADLLQEVRVADARQAAVERELVDLSVRRDYQLPADQAATDYCVARISLKISSEPPQGWKTFGQLATETAELVRAHIPEAKARGITMQSLIVGKAKLMLTSDAAPHPPLPWVRQLAFMVQEKLGVPGRLEVTADS